MPRLGLELGVLEKKEVGEMGKDKDIQGILTPLKKELNGYPEGAGFVVPIKKGALIKESNK